MGPITQAYGHDASGLSNEPVPVMAAVVGDIVVVAEHPIGQPVVAHELPDVFYDVQLGTYAIPPDRAAAQRGAPGLTVRLISAWCRFMPAVLQKGRARAAPVPSLGQTAPKMYVDA